jgi:hypothetical protein
MVLATLSSTPTSIVYAFAADKAEPCSGCNVGSGWVWARLSNTSFFPRNVFLRVGDD